jgi:heme/copper-type cytochrome/quinol oxidase subunit 2
MRSRRYLVAAVIAVLLAAGFFVIRLNASPLPHARTITLDASQWRYTPGIVTVNEGDPVTLIIKASDVTHGFYLDGYNILETVVPGQTVTVRFVATRAGRWMFRCAVTCGAFHPYMIGWLRVQPNTTLRLGLLALGAIGATALYAAWEEGRRS